MQSTTRDLGVLVPIVTPCSRDGQPDTDGIKRVCNYMLGHGCDSIFVAGSTGRGPWWSRADRVKICTAAADSLSGSAPLFAGCMASGLAEMLENARAMADAGADIAVVTAPGYFRYGPDEVETIFRHFADASPLPVMVYDIPQLAGMKLDWEMVARLANHENIVGFKDSSGDMARFRELLRVLQTQGDFYLLQGKEHLLAESLLAGCSGFVVSLIHFDPRPFVALVRAVRSDQVELALRLQERLVELMQITEGSSEKRPPSSTLFYLIDCVLRERGVCDNILLDHEGGWPDWLVANRERVTDVCERAAAVASSSE